MKKGLILFLITVVVMGIIAVACAPVQTDANGNVIQPNSTPEHVEKEMVLVGQYRDIQVYKMVDNIAEVTCYVTLSSRQLQVSSIFCIK